MQVRDLKRSRAHRHDTLVRRRKVWRAYCAALATFGVRVAIKLA